MPVYWEAAERPKLFPTMRGELVAAPLGMHETRLDLSGEYRPPLGLLGRLLDRVVGFRVARATMRSFLDDLAGHLETERPTAD
jgi:hypothetical protein